MGQPLIEIRDLSKTFQTKDTEIHALNAINLTTRMIKTTSLVTLIGVIEVLKVGQQIIETSRFAYPSASLWIYAVVFFLYFIVCFPISRFAKRLEKKWQN